MTFNFIDINNQNREEQLHIQKQAIEHSAVLCYALEGSYPPEITYLEDKYGLIVDRKKFIVGYKAFASNIKPEISVYHAFGDSS